MSGDLVPPASPPSGQALLRSSPPLSDLFFFPYVLFPFPLATYATLVQKDAFRLGPLLFSTPDDRLDSIVWPDSHFKSSSLVSRLSLAFLVLFSCWS